MSRDDKASYYDEGGIETIDIIKAKLTPEQWKGYCLGNAIKYICRLNFKGDYKRDAEKASNYLSWMGEVVDDGWIEHNINGCPVGGDVCVELLFSGGTKNGPTLAKDWGWAKFEGTHCIAAYKIIKETQ